MLRSPVNLNLFKSPKTSQMNPKQLIPEYLALETKVGLLSVSSVEFSSATEQTGWDIEKRDGAKIVLVRV